MRRRTTPGADVWCRGLAALATLAILAAPRAGAQPLFAPAPPSAEQVAVLATAVGSAPQAGLWTTTSALIAGAHPSIRAWDFFGPLSVRHGRTQIGAQTLFLNGFTAVPGLPTALAQLGTLQAGNDSEDHPGCWTLMDTDVLRPFPQAFRDGRIGDDLLVLDGKGMFKGNLEYDAFVQVLVQAYYTSAKAFAAAARHDLTYAQVFAEPARYRGEVLHISGRLGRLARLDPPDDAKAQGVGDQYEAWVYYDAYGLNPFCCVFTELPESLRPYLGEKHLGERKVEIQVAFDGYFYKKFRYKAADSKATTARDAPIFIGHALSVKSLPAPPPADTSDDWPGQLMALFIGIVAIAVLVVVVLTWWFRKSDARVRRRLFMARDTGLVLPPPEVPPAVPVAPPVEPPPPNPLESRMGGRMGDFPGPAR